MLEVLIYRSLYSLLLKGSIAGPVSPDKVTAPGAEYSYRCSEHKPVVPSQCFHDDSPAVEPGRSEQYREDCQRYFNAQDEGAASDRVHVIWCRPFRDVLKRREGRHGEKEGSVKSTPKE
jgi:hypothetical protein